MHYSTKESILLAYLIGNKFGAFKAPNDIVKKFKPLQSFSVGQDYINPIGRNRHHRQVLGFSGGE